jgi:hypothetical protein
MSLQTAWHRAHNSARWSQQWRLSLCVLTPFTCFYARWVNSPFHVRAKKILNHSCTSCFYYSAKYYTRNALTPWCKKVKVKLSRYTPWRRLGWEEVQPLLILNLGTRLGWVVIITPRLRFTPGKGLSGTHWTGCWVGPRAGLDAEARRKILCRGLNPGRLVRSQPLYWLSYPCSCRAAICNDFRGRVTLERTSQLRVNLKFW